MHNVIGQVRTHVATHPRFHHCVGYGCHVLAALSDLAAIPGIPFPLAAAGACYLFITAMLDIKS